MSIEEAIQSIAKAETLTGFNAKMVVDNPRQLKHFVKMIKDQYERDGNKDNLIANYGAEEINTIINYKI